MSDGGNVVQSGAALAARLIANLGWLLGYALLVDAFIGLTIWGAWRVGWVTSWSTLYYIPEVYAAGVVIVNLAAIGWAGLRSAHTDDVLNPRLILSKVRALTQTVSRTRKPSRNDRV